jgi:hypothetical protein
MIINWKTPPPRSGLLGIVDKLVGPGATGAELALQILLPVVAAIAAPLYASKVVEGWTLIQYVICSLLAFDIAGGVITNATSNAKRWYHRAGKDFKQQFAFVSVHLLHLFVVSWLYLAFDLSWFLVAGGYLLIAAVAVLLVPQYLQRPISLIAYVCALLISMYLLQQPIGLEWFLPLFYLKLLVSHLPKEEPYRPA